MSPDAIGPTFSGIAKQHERQAFGGIRPNPSWIITIDVKPGHRHLLLIHDGKRHEVQNADPATREVGLTPSALIGANFGARPLNKAGPRRDKSPAREGMDTSPYFHVSPSITLGPNFL